MSSEKNKKATSPITYYYNPFYNQSNELQFLEVWQVLEDDVLGSLYPWQYVATAETSNRIVTLNFLALKNFENDYRKYYDHLFVYKVSAKLLSEGNVHRLGKILQANLILCFDIYQLEKFGDKASLAGIKFLQNIGATIMISGVDKAPVDVLLKYQANYYLLDYRYYNEQNKGLVAMMKQLADTNAVTIVVGNVNDKSNMGIFIDNGIEIFAGSALVRPRKKLDKFVGKVDDKQELALDEQKQKYIVKDVDAPEVRDNKDAKNKGASADVNNEQEIKEELLEEVTLNITSQRDIFKARLASIAQRKVANAKVNEAEAQEVKQLQKETKALEEQVRKELEAQKSKLNAPKVENKDAATDASIQNKGKKEASGNKSPLGASTISTSTDEFASLNKNKTNNKQLKRGENVIKLNISKPKKKR